jgi:hypothetical protein
MYCLGRKVDVESCQRNLEKDMYIYSIYVEREREGTDVTDCLPAVVAVGHTVLCAHTAHVLPEHRAGSASFVRCAGTPGKHCVQNSR